MGYQVGRGEQIVETDARGRASLGRPGQLPDWRRATAPAVVVTELERQFLANAALQAQIEYAGQHPEQRVDRPRRP